jgi:hypothetical protein
VILTRCDQCAGTYRQGERNWVVIGHVLTEANAADLDDDLEPSLHFCTWHCAATYTTARALVSSSRHWRETPLPLARASGEIRDVAAKSRWAHSRDELNSSRAARARGEDFAAPRPGVFFQTPK